TGGAGNFIVDRNPSKPKSWWDKAIQGTQNFFNGVGHAIGSATNWLNQNVVNPVDNFLNSTVGQVVENTIIGALSAASVLMSAPEDGATVLALGSEVILGDTIASAGRGVFGESVGDTLDETIGTIKTDPGTIAPKAAGVGEALAPEVESIDENGIHHILQSSHNWGKVVEDPNDWNQVSKIVSKVMEEGTEGPYRGVFKKALEVNGKIVEVTYNKMENGEIKISDAWIKYDK
ncbi:MAG: hypothetical protein LBI13_04960, partial [Streptococcaceae bacterium]|nr:hypothetical protein [Streptococcaceae bacterium]